MQRNSRMRDVAELAGVATMTVSRVLNDSAPVAEETRKRVFEAVRRLNYRPNPVARTLRQARSKSIGIIVPNFYDPFFATCAHALSMVAKQHDYSVIVTTSDEDAAAEFTEASLMVLRHVEGLAIIPAATGRCRLHTPEFSGTHIVAFDRPLKGRHFNSVLVENLVGARQAVDHLLGHGHKNICFLGLSDALYTMKARYDGYEQAISLAGHKPHAYFTCTTQEETTANIRRALKHKAAPTAFLAANNLVMRYALHAFSQLKLKIPSSVAIIGFDDFDMADICSPPITVVRQPALGLGRVAGELLFSRLRHKQADEPGERVVLPVELIIRRSCGCGS